MFKVLSPRAARQVEGILKEVAASVELDGGKGIPAKWLLDTKDLRTEIKGSRWLALALCTYLPDTTVPNIARYLEISSDLVRRSLTHLHKLLTDEDLWVVARNVIRKFGLKAKLPRRPAPKPKPSLTEARGLHGKAEERVGVVMPLVMRLMGYDPRLDLLYPQMGERKILRLNASRQLAAALAVVVAMADPDNSAFEPEAVRFVYEHSGFPIDFICDALDDVPRLLASRSYPAMYDCLEFLRKNNIEIPDAWHRAIQESYN